MSVYTSVARDTLESFLTHYDIGELVDFHGISAGIENTNYFIDTTSGRYVLTLFESLGFDELPYFLNLMAFLAEHNVPSAHPVADKQGQYLRTLHNKPTSIVQCLEGSDTDIADRDHATVLGDALAHLHLAGQQYDQHRANGRGPHWWRETINKLEGHIPEQDQKLLCEEIEFQMSFSHANLPRGVTHADLFKDNVLWNGNKLTGFIDFYYACDDVLLYDIAVTVNAWFSRPDSSLDSDLCNSFLEYYEKHRPLNDEEKKAWPVMLRAAALRFWLSRLNDKYFPKPGEITHIKNPDEFRAILIDRIKNHDHY